MVPTQDQLEELDAVEDVLTVGYPRGLYDEEHYYPLFRRGITASHPAVDFNGKPRTVIDAACFPGSSGSPVFIHKTGAVADKSGNVNIGGGYSYLIGVLSSGPTITSTGEIKVEDIPTVERPVTYVQSMMHLGYIEKSREIMAFLETLKLENQEVPAVKL